MLDGDYQRLLGKIMSSLSQQIRLPPECEDFFSQTGPTAPYPNDMRSSARTRVRTHGVLLPESPLPTFPREPEPIAIYTADFSKTGFGFVAAEQFYPGEDVRILLATFWMQVKIHRCRRLGESCYTSGGTLSCRHDPSPEAFDRIAAVV